MLHVVVYLISSIHCTCIVHFIWLSWLYNVENRNCRVFIASVSPFSCYFPSLRLEYPSSSLCVSQRKFHNRWQFRFSRQRVWRWLSSEMLHRVVCLKFTDFKKVVTVPTIKAIFPRSKHLWNVGSVSTKLPGAISQKTVIFRFIPASLYGGVKRKAVTLPPCWHQGGEEV
jgi:hypothetical protein